MKITYFLILLSFALSGCLGTKSYYSPNGVANVNPTAKGQVDMAAAATNISALEMRGSVQVAKDLHLSTNLITDIGESLEGNTYTLLEGGLLKSIPIDSTQFHQFGLFVGGGKAGNFHSASENSYASTSYLQTPIRKITAQYAYALDLKKSDVPALLFRARFLPKTASQVVIGARVTHIGIDKNSDAPATDYPSKQSYNFIEPFVIWKAGKGRFQFQHQILYSLALNANKPINSNEWNWSQSLEKHYFGSLQQNIGFTLKF